MNYLQCELISSGRGISRRGGFRMSSQVYYKRGDSDESISDLEENGFAPSLFLSKNAVQGLQELDASDDLDDFPKALTTILKALSKAAEAKGAAQKEAAEWKKKYEIEKAQNSRLLHRGSDDLSSESDVSDQQEILSPDPVDTPIPDNDHSEKCCGKHGICAHQFLCDKTSESDFKIVPSKVIRKASFRLAWGFNGDKSQHKHDVVSFDKGDITTAQRSSKQIALKWESQPQTLVLLTKPNSKSVQIMCAQMIRWLKDHKKLDIIVEPRVRDELMSESSYFDFVQTWEKDDEILLLHTKVDLVITLGGDGTVLWAASLFKGPVPPVVSFSMGSLGFMTPFQIEHYQKHLDLILMEPFSITLRHRLQCHVVKKGSEDDNEEPILVLNEVTIDRGISSYLTNLECYCDGSFVTSVQGDGLILSTTSGSTAYSLAAGGSVVHPQVPGILFTPICPHSLSFRPLILPEYVTVRVQVPYKSRGQAWASFDGKGRIQLSAGDALICSMAAWPVPTACRDDSTNDFFGSINNSLHWNLRKTQSFDGPVDPVD